MFDINPEQEALDKKAGTPIAGGQLSPEEQSLKAKILELVSSESIKLHEPASLFHEAEDAQKDFSMMKVLGILAKIRQLVDFYEHPADTLFHEKTLLQALLYDIQDFENRYGDFLKL